MTHKSLHTVSSKKEHNNFGNCKTESVPHSCSFITGALIERIRWFTLEDRFCLFNHQFSIDSVYLRNFMDNNDQGFNKDVNIYIFKCKAW